MLDTALTQASRTCLPPAVRCLAGIACCGTLVAPIGCPMDFNPPDGLTCKLLTNFTKLTDVVSFVPGAALSRSVQWRTLRMIVLKDAQDKVLAALLSVARIVERCHTLPILVKVLLRDIAMGLRFSGDPAIRNCREHDARGIPASGRALACKPRAGVSGVFSAVKVNLRNAP